MSDLPEEYRVAREVYQTIKIVPTGHRVSRPEINARLRATSDERKLKIIDKVLRSMVRLRQVQKRLDQGSCTVYFWATETDNTSGDPPSSFDPREPLTNYLVDPIPQPEPIVKVVKETLERAGESPLHSQAMAKEGVRSIQIGTKVINFDVEDDDADDITFALPPGADEEDEGEETFYMMKHAKNKKMRVLLRSEDGSTLDLTVEEIEFIRSLKPPFVTL